MDNELLTFIIKSVQKFYAGEKVQVFLFGSRARGDFNERSDWDFAIKVDHENSEFFLEIQNNAPTLCGIDMVYLNSAGPELKREILTQGKMIYETK